MFKFQRRQAETLPTLLSPFCYTESAAVIFTFALGQSITLYYPLFSCFKHKKLQYKCLLHVPTFPPT